jgi:hypothetical protein
MQGLNVNLLGVKNIPEGLEAMLLLKWAAHFNATTSSHSQDSSNIIYMEMKNKLCKI